MRYFHPLYLLLSSNNTLLLSSNKTLGGGGGGGVIKEPSQLDRVAIWQEMQGLFWYIIPLGKLFQRSTVEVE
jgi:hypothetical protein